jgi:Tc5 transposase DNA-binding domain/DDE superfamily endonuclease
MASNNEEIELRIQAALVELEESQRPNARRTARDFDVPYRRLWRRWTSRTMSLVDNGGHNKALGKAQEAAICQYIDLLEAMGLPIREKTLPQTANDILRRHHEQSGAEGPPRQVSKMWAVRFLRRHPDYKKRAMKPLSQLRKRAHDPEGIEKWFDGLRRVREERGILDEDIHNMDETGFRIGCGRAHMVITRSGNQKQYLQDPDNRDYLTLIESISAAGISHAPMVILKSATIIERWVADSLPGNYILANSESGYTNDKLNLQWLYHFERTTRNSTHGGWRHFQPSFVLYAEEHNIILYSLPPHTSHLLQPLDVVCFQPYKHYHAEVIDNAVRTGDTRFSKIEFLHALHGIRTQTFKSSTIFSAFRKCGIVPYDSSMVTDGLWEA